MQSADTGETRTGNMAKNNKSYADELRDETFGLPAEEVTPTAIRDLPPIRGLRLLSRRARLGGKLTGHLTRLTDEELEERTERSRKFVSDTSTSQRG